MSVSSSPDPISLAMESSPVRGSQRHSKGPLSSRSINISSPSKSIYLDPKDGDDTSAWRIKVTVQAEPASPRINRNIIPSKATPRECRGSSPAKRLTRRSRKTASSPVKDSPRKAASTRRRNDSIQSHDLIVIPDDESNDYSLSEIGPSSMSAYDEYDGGSRSHGQGSISNDKDSIDRHYRSGETCQSTASTCQERVDSQSQDRFEARDAQATANVIPPSRTNTSPGFPTEQNWTDDEEEATVGAHAPGEATVLESEEFSMISVDSLSSVPHMGDHHTPVTVSEPWHKSEPNKPVDVSYMPSSPPTYMPSSRRTPLPFDFPPKHPAAPMQSSCQHNNVDTPLQESARKSGRALQDVLKAPCKASDSRASTSSRDDVFNGFSSGTRRQLRQSLYTGQNLAIPQLNPQTNFGLGVSEGPRFAQPELTANFSSPFHSPVRVTSNVASHRLPTPEEKDAQCQAQEPAARSLQIQYPSLAGALQGPSFAKPALASPYIEYDAMSWVATKATGATQSGRPPLIQPVSADKQDSSSPKTSLPTAPISEAETGSSTNVHTPEESPEDAPSQPFHTEESGASKDIWQEEADLWQEEASRSIHEDTPPILRDDVPIRPRRAKIPGTWRRISEAHFSYSDSPEPEDVAMRKVSATTSASGIMTPPVTEDEGVQGGAQDECNVSESSPDEHLSADEATAPTTSSQSSPESDGEDTGVFWQNNLPSVFNRPVRPSKRRARTEVSSPNSTMVVDAAAEDRNFAGSSPLRNTIFDISPEKAKRSPLKIVRVSGGIKRNPQSDSVVMLSPLRHSLLRSSKVRDAGRPGQPRFDEMSREPSVAHTQEEESLVQDTSSSMASDARQLQNEMSQYLAGDRTPLDMTQESLSEQPHDDATPSYVEELNRESPVRIRVNFNDSSTVSSARDVREYVHDGDGRSMMLSPKKQYPALFENAPSLNPKISQPRVRKNGFVSRLTDSFWDAVTAPVPYAPAEGKPGIVISSSLIPEEASASTGTVAKVIPPATSSPQQAKSVSSSMTPSVPDHVLRLRRKYGLLPDTHPFTYAHIRTLHRMLNSIRATQPSLIPSSGPLPPNLTPLLNKTVSNDLDQIFTWTEKYVHMVDAYMSLLLPASQRKRLVEHTGQDWGDEEAKKYQGFDSKGRHGTQKVFKLEEKGKVTQRWVVGIVEGILFKEEMNARKRKVKGLLAMESSAVSA